MAIKIDKHWAFLEEIEAPMWVDLTKDARGSYQDVDDGWFHMSHMYHQCPSLELKAAFAYSGEGNGSSGIDFNGPSSPKLPSSVSGSRGKNNRSKRQKEADYVFPWIKQHPVKVFSGKYSLNAGSHEEIKPKGGFINSEGTWRKKGSIVVDRTLTGNAKEHPSEVLACHGDSEQSSSCTEVVGSNTSTLTTDNDQKIRPKNLEVSSQAFGHSNGLISSLRSSLRKSRVTRQASRIDVSKRKKSMDSNTVSGNSSAGSSNTFSVKQLREEAADGRNGARMTRVIRSKVRDAVSSKLSNIQVKEGTYNSGTGRINNGSKQAKYNASKLKVQNQAVRAKALVLSRVNDQRLSPPTVKAQDMAVGTRLVSAGTENKPGRVPANQKVYSRYITTGVMARAQKGTKHEGASRGDRARLPGQKEKGSSPRCRGKNPALTTQSIYLR